MLYPEVCPLCSTCGVAPCQVCGSKVKAPGGVASAPPGVDGLFSLTLYEDLGAQLVRAIKFQNRRDSLRWAAAEIAGQVGMFSFDVVTWVPSSKASLRHRGFEPASLVADQVARRLNVDSAGLLSRRRDDVGQRTKTRRDRLDGPALRLRRSVPGPAVLLIDDVVTTGATLTTAAGVLRGGGARFIYAGCLARKT